MTDFAQTLDMRWRVEAGESVEWAGDLDRKVDASDSVNERVIVTATVATHGEYILGIRATCRTVEIVLHSERNEKEAIGRDA
ncbi:MAG TPA: hypothetical protein VMD09_02070 [Solirubrobacteraceae bacterium]|nr:hypothetical protein [Solirubrobacteraceae bacterium]